MIELKDIKKAFYFLHNEYKMEIIRCDYYEEAFGDIVIDYQNEDITLRVIRDRLQISIEIKIDNEWYDYIFLRAIIQKINFEKFDNRDINWYLEEKDIYKIVDEIKENMNNLIKIVKDDRKADTLNKLKLLLKTYNKNRGWIK